MKLNQVLRVGLISAGTTLLLIIPAQLAHAQSVSDPAAIRQELGLNRSQMRQLRDIMQDYQAELANVLTAEQLAEMQDLREATREDDSVSESERLSQEDIIAELDLSDDQVQQLAQARESLEQDLEAVLTPDQLEKLAEMVGI
ncbi:MAG: hypothetical protein AAF892_07825 [Cyanobacteria bacterium P01_D01_bin.71]